MKGTLCTCSNGHRYYKSNDCPVCPACWRERKPQSGFMAGLSAPARRALENAGIYTVAQLADRSEKEILSLHGMGKASLPKLRAALSGAGLLFKKA